MPESTMRYALAYSICTYIAALVQAYRGVLIFIYLISVTMIASTMQGRDEGPAVARSCSHERQRRIMFIHCQSNSRPIFGTHDIHAIRLRLR